MDALEAQILNASSGLSVELPTSLTGFRSRPRPRRPLAERVPEEDVGISGASQIDERPREVEDPNKSLSRRSDFQISPPSLSSRDPVNKLPNEVDLGALGLVFPSKALYESVFKSEKSEDFVQESAVEVRGFSRPQMLCVLLVEAGFDKPGGGRRYSRAESSTDAQELSFLTFDPGALLIRWEAGTNSGTSGDRLLEKPPTEGEEVVRSNSFGRGKDGFLLFLKLLKLS